MKTPGVSVVIASRNRSSLLRECLDALLDSDYTELEIIVINDGSTDNTEDLLKEYKKKFDKKIVHLKNKIKKGWAISKNYGIRNSKYDYIILIDDDIIVSKNFVKNLTHSLTSQIKDKVAIVSAIDYHTGHSIVYSKEVMAKAGLFDERFNRNLRQDTDLNFRIMDMGYKMKLTNKAKFLHKHPKPTELRKKIKFAINRILVHQMDVLLYKNNKKRGKKFFDVKMGFLVNPIRDFRTATGLWRDDKKMSLSSPEGVKIIENKTFIHLLFIITLGLFYTSLVKFARLSGSFKYKKLLI